MTATAAYPALFSPLQLAGVTVPNRIVMAPMSTALAGTAGEVTRQQIAFYRARVHGGVGMIIVEFTSVHRASGLSEHRQLSLEDDSTLEGHRALVRMIKSGGSVACLQLQHGGPFARRDLIEGGVARGPVDIPSKRHPSGLGVKALNDSELQFLIDCFGRSAELAMRAGYDAIELHGAHGYLLTAFLSPHTNKRTDAWGGDEQRRMRFPAEVVARVKAAVGDRPLIFRLSADEFVPGGLTITDMERIAPHLVAAGADAIHASMGIGNGSYDKVLDPMSAAEGWKLPYSRRLRKACGVPVITAGQIRWPEVAEQALRDGDADMVALGRPLLADPEWAAKARQLRTADIIPCTSCNYCVMLAETDRGVGCAENPRTGRELDPPVPICSPPGRRAVVVGAGPGGIVAAVLLAEAGYRTELHEARAEIGGGLIASAAPPYKEKLSWYLHYLRRRLEQSDVSVHVGHTVDVAAIIEERPAVVILANGARAMLPPIEGIDRPFVFDAYEALMGDDQWLAAAGSGGTMAVYGGGETGCELSEYLAARGYPVLLVTRSPKESMARSADRIYRSVLLKRIERNECIEIIDNSQILAIEAHGVRVADRDGRSCVRAAAGVFIAQGRRPQTESAQWQHCEVAVRVIGDSRQCGRIGDAVRDAYAAVMSLGQQRDSSPP